MHIQAHNNWVSGIRNSTPSSFTEQTFYSAREEQGFLMVGEDLAQGWQAQLDKDFPEQSAATKESIIRWLLGKNPARFERLEPQRLEIAQQGMAYRYRLLHHRYLRVGPEQGYRHLLTRLGSLVLLRDKIRAWVAISHERQRGTVDVLQEVIQELLQSDRYMQQQIAWIAECTNDRRLRNALLLASTEEYCLRPIRNQPLLVYRFVNYLNRHHRGGITQVPSNDFIKLVSEQVLTSDGENPINLLDDEALAQYQETQAMEDLQLLRKQVKQKFEKYLAQKLGELAVQWLQLYLQGMSQEQIAAWLNLPVKQVYRLREKVTYHAVHVFALKLEPELVTNWLETSLTEHSLGLSSKQWERLLAELSPRQQRICQLSKVGKNLNEIAQELHLKPHQVMGEWSKVYLAAQALRSSS